jgi:SAM-dependent methyltransferase
VHDGLVGERALVGQDYLADPELRRQYEQEIAPRTRVALGRILDEMAGLDGVRRVLDLGAGTGAAGNLIRERLEGRRQQAAPAHPERATLSPGPGPGDRELAAQAPGAGGVEVVSVDRVAATPGVVVADLRHKGRPAGVSGQFDLIVAAHLLNELAATLDVTARAAIVFAWARELLAPGGRLVLIEPALRETSRDLLEIRDRLLPAGFFVEAPCLLQGPCPALARDRDWCHASAPWPAEEAAARAGQSRVDYSYLVLARAGEASRERRLFRVVSDPIVEKGRLRLWGCGPAGRHNLVRLDRDRTPTNEGFDEAARGDLLVAADTTRAGDGLRIGPTSRVERR